MKKRMQGKDLQFISQIRRDGSGTDPVGEMKEHLKRESFTVNCLSLTYRTYIACGFNSYVVKLRKEPQP